MEMTERALELFRNNRNCAQAVYAAAVGASGGDEGLAEASAAAFGAGMGRKQLTCGALTGAAMALGAKAWDPRDPKGSKERVYALTRRLFSEFETLNGSTECLRLLGVNLQDPNLSAYAAENGLFKKTCERLVASACGILQALETE